LRCGRVLGLFIADGISCKVASQTGISGILHHVFEAYLHINNVATAAKSLILVVFVEGESLKFTLFT